ncbi:MAG: phosphopantothenoylcysteine decarboxylase [Phycisphaera sp. TMED9]|nr:MAG: phosphopantothenoylcysteine decarboxylase [Phycisphaera sp. TMED9]
MSDSSQENPTSESLVDRKAFEGRRILIGVCGGIAAYKVASVVSALAQSGAEVTVAMTESATRFVTPLTFQALSGRSVFTSQWDQFEAADPQHVRLAADLDVALVAPCTMNSLARIAGGFADDAVTAVLSAIDRNVTPVLLAPSMNTEMWGQPATGRNLELVKSDGYRVIEPGVGWQACRRSGAGRLPEPEMLLAAIAEVLG